MDRRLRRIDFSSPEVTCAAKDFLSSIKRLHLPEDPTVLIWMKDKMQVTIFTMTDSYVCKFRINTRSEGLKKQLFIKSD